MKLTGKKALITGGNSGIGLATARLFIAEGAKVAITGRDQKTLDEAVAELGPHACGYRVDVTIAEDRKRLFAALKNTALADRTNVYRHATALGLFEKRRRNIRAALERIIGRAGDVKFAGRPAYSPRYSRVTITHCRHSFACGCSLGALPGPDHADQRSGRMSDKMD